MNNIKLKLKVVAAKISRLLSKVRKYSILAFLLFVVLIYGFVLLRTTNLSQAEPSSDAVSSQVRAAQLPYIDQKVVKQLESLQDNSVSVKALFDDARSNPFQ